MTLKKHMKKVILFFTPLFVVLFLVGGIFILPGKILAVDAWDMPAQQNISTCQFVNLLININVITSDKANQARAALNCAADSSWTEAESTVLNNIINDWGTGTVVEDDEVVSSDLGNGVIHSTDGSGVMVVGDSDSLQTRDKLTLEAWVKPMQWSSVSGISGTKEQVIISKGKIGENVVYALSLDNGKLVYSNNDSAIWTDSAVVPLNRWTHVAVSINESSLEINMYVNGNKQTSVSEGSRGVFNNAQEIYKGNSITESSVTANVYVGNFYPSVCSTFTNKGNGFVGLIDDIRIWNVARTEAQIKNNMSTSVKNSSGLMAYYSFDDETASDISTQSNTGAVKNGMTIIEDQTVPSAVVEPVNSLGEGFTLAEECDSYVEEETPEPVATTTVNSRYQVTFGGYIEKIEDCLSPNPNRYKMITIKPCGGSGNIVSSVYSAPEPGGPMKYASDYAVSPGGSLTGLFYPGYGDREPQVGDSVLGIADSNHEARCLTASMKAARIEVSSLGKSVGIVKQIGSGSQSCSVAPNQNIQNNSTDWLSQLIQVLGN